MKVPSYRSLTLPKQFDFEWQQIASGCASVEGIEFYLDKLVDWLLAWLKNIYNVKQENIPRVIVRQYAAVVAFQVNYLDESYQKKIREKISRENKNTHVH